MILGGGREASARSFPGLELVTREILIPRVPARKPAGLEEAALGETPVMPTLALAIEKQRSTDETQEGTLEKAYSSILLHCTVL